MHTVEQRFQNDTFQLVTPKSSLSDRVRAAFSRLGEFILSLATSNQDPKITITRDRSGQAQWNIYDPTSGYSNSFLSEDDVRVWLDNRYR